MLLLLPACATLGGGGLGKGKDPDMLSGVVNDPHGRPISFAKVSVVPEAVVETGKKRRKEPEPLPDGARGLAVTTEGGRWLVDHVSDDLGEQVGMPRNYYYEVTVYKPGFHPWKDSILFEKGTLQVDVILYPDTIDIDDIGHLMDPSIDDTNTGAGVLRQGE
jgi:hypothetical protein